MVGTSVYTCAYGDSHWLHYKEIFKKEKDLFLQVVHYVSLLRTSCLHIYAFSFTHI